MKIKATYLTKNPKYRYGDLNKTPHIEYKTNGEVLHFFNDGAAVYAIVKTDEGHIVPIYFSEEFPLIITE